MSLKNPSRHLLAFASGVLGGFIPNNFSNIPPILMGAALALFYVKVLLGDLDYGLNFTVKDVLFVLVFASEGALGAWIAQQTL